MPLLFAVIVPMLAAQSVRAELLEKTKKVGAATVHYKVVLPNGFDPLKAYPAILVFGGGPQTMETVDRTLDRNFRAEAEKRGYIVIAPAAPGDQLFFEDGARIFPEFLNLILADYKIQDKKFHIAGPSNGGIAAFHVAALNPQYFLSVTAFPGYMWEPSAAKLQAISKMCVFMYVGENDEYMWHGEMQKEAEILRSKGTLAAIPSRRVNRTGSIRWPARKPGGCSTDSRKPGKVAVKRRAPPVWASVRSGRLSEEGFMFRLMLVLGGTCLSLAAQDAASEFRNLLAATPRLPLEEVVVAAKMANAADLGIVSSIAADRRGVIHILQRGDKADPVIVVNAGGKVLRSWGKGMYTVPHSIRIDGEGNIWTVDAGSSTILKFSPEGKKLQQIDVGEVATGKDCFTPALCGTTDIAFGPGGRLYISDGYGNGRVLEYTADGKRVRVWGSKGTGAGQFQVPHGIATDGQTVFVADRQNMRIQRFDMEGAYRGEWTHVGRPFSLKLASGSLWVGTMTLEATGAKPWVLQLDPTTGKVLRQMPSPGPHAIDVSDTGEVYATGCCGGAAPSSFSVLRHTP
jgi:DNA-binding beta-propeller fold protein YncE/predicted esterase